MRFAETLARGSMINSMVSIINAIKTCIASMEKAVIVAKSSEPSLMREAPSQ